MAMSTSRLAIFVALIILGLYFVLFHTPPWPLDHESIGLGTNHFAHTVFGVILLAGSGYIWWKSR